MAALWRRLRQYLGLSWTRERGEAGGSESEAWLEALQDFTTDQIARGVKSCREWEDGFPPNLGQFRKLCLTPRPEERQTFTDKRIERERREGKSVGMLEHLARSAHSDIAKRELERMRRIMAGEHVETKQESYRKTGQQTRWGHLGSPEF